MFPDVYNRMLFQAYRDGRLAIFDYPYKPKRRDGIESESAQKLKKALSKNDEMYSQIIDGFEILKDDLGRIPAAGDPNGVEPFWVNEWFSHFDAISLYTLIRTKKPKVYLEIGSGNSTKFARRAISDGGLSTKIVSIDPQPRAEIDLLCDILDRRTLESLRDKDVLKYLNQGDIVFFDGSHRSFQGSDVTVFFTEIMPALPVGIVYGIHDVFLPDDYPEEWRGRYYNEQYLLQLYIYGGCGGDEVIFPVSYVCSHLELSVRCQKLIEYWGYKAIRCGGGAFWLRRHREV